MDRTLTYNLGPTGLRGWIYTKAATAQVRAQRTPQPGALAVKQDDLKCRRPAGCLRQFKESKILAVRGQESGPAGEIMGSQVVRVPFAAINDAWQAADQDESRAIADRWEKTAARVIGVSEIAGKSQVPVVPVVLLAFPALAWHRLCHASVASDRSPRVGARTA